MPLSRPKSRRRFRRSIRFRGRYEVILIRPAVSARSRRFAVAEHGLPMPARSRPFPRLARVALARRRSREARHMCSRAPSASSSCRAMFKVGVQQVHTFERERARASSSARVMPSVRGTAADRWLMAAAPGCSGFPRAPKRFALRGGEALTVSDRRGPHRLRASPLRNPRRWRLALAIAPQSWPRAQPASVAAAVS